MWLKCLSVYLHSGHVPGRQGSAHDSVPTYRTFTAGDGLGIAVTANTEKMWQQMAKLLGVVELIDDPRFLTNRERLANSSELLALLEKPFLAKTAQQWMDAFLDASIPAGVVNTLDLALSSAQVQHRDMVMSLEDDVGHRIRVVGNPIKFDGADTTPRHYPPRLGQDTEAVLKNVLGKSQAEIVGLMAKSVVFQAASPNAT